MPAAAGSASAKRPRPAGGYPVKALADRKHLSGRPARQATRFTFQRGWLAALTDVQDQLPTGKPVVSAGAISVALALAAAMDPAGTCWPGVPLLAKRLRVTKGTVQDGLDILIYTGWLIKVQGGGRTHSNNYYAAVPADDADLEAKVRELFGTRADAQELLTALDLALGTSPAPKPARTRKSKGVTGDTLPAGGADQKGVTDARKGVTSDTRTAITATATLPPHTPPSTPAAAEQQQREGGSIREDQQAPTGVTAEQWQQWQQEKERPDTVSVHDWAVFRRDMLIVGGLVGRDTIDRLNDEWSMFRCRADLVKLLVRHGPTAVTALSRGGYQEYVGLTTIASGIYERLRALDRACGGVAASGLDTAPPAAHPAGEAYATWGLGAPRPEAPSAPVYDELTDEAAAAALAALAARTGFSLPPARSGTFG